MEKFNINTEQIVEEFFEQEETFEYYKDNCVISKEWDDFRKWKVIEDAPTAKDFYRDLEEFAEEQLGRQLTQEEDEELVIELDKSFDQLTAGWNESILEMED